MLGDRYRDRLLSPGRWSLGGRLTLAFLLLLLILQVIVVATYRGHLDERRAAELQNAVVVGQTAAALVDGFARDLEGVTLVTALALRDEELDQATTGPLLAALTRQYQVLRSVFIADLSARVVASDSGAGIGVDLAARSYMQRLQSGADTVWSEGVLGLETGEITVAFGRAIWSAEGARRAYLMAAFHPARLVDRLPVPVPSDAVVIFIDEQGMVLFASDQPDVRAVARDVSQHPAVRAALQGAMVQLAGTPRPLSGTPVYGVLVPAGRIGWVVGYARPAEAVDGPLRARFLRQSIAITAVMLLAAVILAIVVRQLARPLHQLAVAAAAIARGEAPTLPPLPADREIRQLGLAMQVMIQAIAQREARLRESVAQEAASRAAAEAAQRRLAFLAEASKELAGSLDPEVTLRTVARIAVPIMADECIAYVISRNGEPRVRRVEWAHVNPEKRPLVEELLDRHPMDLSSDLPVARVLRSGRPVLLTDFSQGLSDYDISDPDRLRLLRALDRKSMIVVPILSGGQPLGAIAFATADSGRRYNEDDLALAQELAVRASLAVQNAQLYRDLQQALSTRDALVAAASHDLKNPLTAIRGTTQLLQRQVQRNALSPERLATGLASIAAGVAQMVTQLDELVDVANLRAGRPLRLNPARVDLADLARHAVEAHQHTTDRHRIRLDAPPDPVIGTWDPVRIERVLNNLLSNAIKYSPKGGDVIVSVRQETTATGAWAVLEVSDQGIGIPAPDLPHTFEAFHRSRNVVGKFAGTGLGLASVRQIVEQHGGSVAVASEEGVGSTFTVRLPLSPSESAAVAGGSSP